MRVTATTYDGQTYDYQPQVKNFTTEEDLRAVLDHQVATNEKRHKAPTIMSVEEPSPGVFKVFKDGLFIHAYRVVA